MNLSQTRALLDRHGLHLSRDLGQNFLVDDAQGARLARLAGVQEGDHVIEVGTGLGALTRALAERAASVVTIEIDSGVVRALEAESLLPDNVRLLHDDALRLDWSALVAEFDGPVRVVANLPYSAATPLLRRMLDLRERLLDWSVMIQSEVARRITARAGTRDYGSLAVLHGLTVDAQIEAELPPAAFFPAPKVQSSFIRVWPRAKQALSDDELLQVERVARASFAQRRKTIHNTLRAGGFVSREDRGILLEVLEQAAIDPGARAETVAPERFLALTRAMAERELV